MALSHPSFKPLQDRTLPVMSHYQQVAVHHLALPKIYTAGLITLTTTLHSCCSTPVLGVIHRVSIAGIQKEKIWHFLRCQRFFTTVTTIRHLTPEVFTHKLEDKLITQLGGVRIFPKDTLTGILEIFHLPLQWWAQNSHLVQMCVEIQFLRLEGLALQDETSSHLISMSP